MPQAQPSRHAPSAPRVAYANIPAWLETAVSNLKRPLSPAGFGDPGVSFPPEDELPIMASLGKALGMPVTAVQGTSAAPAGSRGLILRLTMDPKAASSWWLGMHQPESSLLDDSTCRQRLALLHPCDKPPRQHILRMQLMYTKAVAHGLQHLLHACGETHSSSTQMHMASWSTARRFFLKTTSLPLGML